QRELNKIVDSLEIELEAKPKVVYKIKYVPKEVEKPVDSIKIDKDSVQVEDYYPQKDNYFVKYKNKISLADSTGIGEWTFQPISLSGVISQREDGIFQADFKTPEWLKIEDVDIQAIPLEPPKIDNFGWILGGGLGKDFKADETFVRLSAGLRYKKFFLDVGATTNQTLDAGIKVEF
ncbi:MAG: hypothetical protein KDH96_08095, partial [Candidatus Riesia sp.]|nr:hypothetical protein [Candidatus Riesia sp.]